MSVSIGEMLTTKGIHDKFIVRLRTLHHISGLSLYTWTLHPQFCHDSIASLKGLKKSYVRYHPYLFLV